MMMLFLPEGHLTGRVQSEIVLDLFLVAIVVGLIYSTFFFIPVQRMLPADATLRNINISDLQSLLLLIAGFVRLQFARVPATRNLLLRLTIFLMVCAIATLIGDWLGLHYHSSSAWFDLGWGVPIVAAGLVAFTWTPAAEPQFQPEPDSFFSFIGTNLALVTMLSGIALLTDRWKQAYGGVLTNVAIAASLLALTLRLALTQFHQHQEISQRRSAQQQLAVSHEKIAGLLDSARRQTAEITQINELGTVLQASACRDEAFRVIPERLARLFPDTSGTLSILNPSRTRAEVVAEWGIPRPGSTQPQIADELASRREPISEPGSISIPLIARDEAIGVLFFQDQGESSIDPLLSRSNERAHFRQLASALAEHIALTISNLDLRAELLTQAIRDPLTGLYNRRYMQEALERELHRARRRERPLSVMMIDIDHFKRYNDTFGHSAGDDALSMVAEVLMASIRAEDLACRYGGEEFVVILPECGLPQAALRAKEVCTNLRGLCARRPGDLPEVVTVSIGVAAFQETTGAIDLLLKFADDALYQAKREGRDRVVVARPALTDPQRSRPSRLPVAEAPESSVRS
jgi:diguanylate cyclase (GGDEF)-like protein